MLSHVDSVNSFEVGNQLTVSPGEAATLFLQLLDASQDTALGGFDPPGRRYVAATGATLAVKMESLDDSKVYTRTASRPYAADGSIWSFAVLATDTIRGTVSLTLTLTEGSPSVVRTARMPAAVDVAPVGPAPTIGGYY